MKLTDSDTSPDNQSRDPSSRTASPGPILAWKPAVRNRFQLMNLPPELRDMIYTFALGVELYPITSPLQPDINTQGLNGHLYLGYGHDSAWYSDRFPSKYVAEASSAVPRPNLNLLLVDRRIHSEVLEYAWRKLYKCFVILEVFLAATRAQRGPAMNYAYIPRTSITQEVLGYLSRIELNFSNKEYFQMFGVETDQPERVYIAGSSGASLQAIKGLKFLDLRFRSPQDGWNGCPFNGGDRPFVCCQRTMVDWICTFAWPFIANRGIQIKLSGAVKMETKQKWESIFAGRAPHDQNAAMQAILSTPRHDLPPRCCCRQKCLIEVSQRSSDHPWPYDFDEDMFDTEDDTRPKHGKYIWKKSNWVGVDWKDHVDDETGFALDWPDEDGAWEHTDEDFEYDMDFKVVWDFGVEKG